MTSSLRSLAFALVALCMFGSSALAVDLKEAQKEIADGKAILIDVREEKEWNEAHFEKAILIPGSQIASGEHKDKVLKKLDTKKPEQKIYCHCKSGGRAKYAARVLEKLGVEVIPITQSYKEMVQTGFEEADSK